MTTKLCIGLFGTCGGSTWREKFIEAYKRNSYEYFNPQKDDWSPEDSNIEAEHLSQDGIIIMPILKDTYGIGSLTEVSFMLLSATKDSSRNFIFYIEDADPSLKSKNELYDTSVRTRALIKAHLKQSNLSNVFVVDNLDDMLDLSLTLYSNMKTYDCYCKKYSTKG